MTPWSDIARTFSTTAVVHLATVGSDGGPRSVPLWVDLQGESDLVFFTEAGSLKDRNIARDPRVALSLTAPDNPFDMATVRGEVVKRIEGDAALETVDRISRKYSGEPYPVRTGLVALIVRPTSWWARDYSAG
jgi:PPOX class probable F420-dependent enzyme